MKFRRSEKRKKIRATVDLIPLINCVFLLLFFFMVSGSFVVQDAIDIRMPLVEGGTPAYLEKDVSITLTQEEITLPQIDTMSKTEPEIKSNLFVNETPMRDVHQLARMLEELHASKPDMRVLLRSDARVESARFIQVLSIVKAVGFEHCAIAAQSEIATQSEVATQSEMTTPSSEAQPTTPEGLRP
jgi:biopolymer transport protein ExbD